MELACAERNSPLYRPRKKINHLKLLTINGLTYLFADRTGLEPATSCVTGRHSNQLNYQSLFIWLFGYLVIWLFSYLVIYSNCLNQPHP